MLSAKVEAEKTRATELWYDFPRRCFNSGDNLYYNLQFDAHHIHPLYLGGYDVDNNLCALERDQHQRGHRRLDYQEGMGDIYRYQFGICSEYLSDHPAGQKYKIEGEK